MDYEQRYQALRNGIISKYSEHAQSKLSKLVTALQEDKGTRQNATTGKADFFNLLIQCAEQGSLFNLAYKPDSETQRFVADIDETVSATVSQSSFGQGSYEEKMFLFFYINSQKVLSAKVLNSIVLQFTQSDSVDLKETNWKIALAVYQKLRDSKDKKTIALCQQMLVGYVNKYFLRKQVMDEYNDLVQHEKRLSGIATINDSLYYRMMDSTQKVTGCTGPYEETFKDDLHELRGGHTAEYPVYDNGNLLPYPVVYDKAFCDIGFTFIKEVNRFYQEIKVDKQEKVRPFVKKLNKFDKDVRLLQAQMEWIDDPDALAENIQQVDELVSEPAVEPDAEDSKKLKNNIRIEEIKSSIKEKYKDLSQQATDLRKEARDLFNKGKPNSILRKLLGASLMVLGFGLIGLGVVALVFPPLGVVVKIAGVSTVVAAKVVLCGGAAKVTLYGGATLGSLGVASVFSGVSCFFKRPQPVMGVVNGLIRVCEVKAKEACFKIDPTSNPMHSLKK